MGGCGGGGGFGGGLGGGLGGGSEYKRDLPPTPSDLTVSCITLDDDSRSFHIYEEIPDLPFRCTPEGELRISLAREEAFRLRQEAVQRLSSSSSYPFSLNSSSSARNISPYMVVPLEMRHCGTSTPAEFRTITDRTIMMDGDFSAEFAGNVQGDSPGPTTIGTNFSTNATDISTAGEFRGLAGASAAAHNTSFALVGRKRVEEDGSNNGPNTHGPSNGSGGPTSAVGPLRNGLATNGGVGDADTPSPVCETPSQAGCSSPSCGSSVFGSPLDILGRCSSSLGGDGGGDMSDRLLSAINLTRLLAAVR